MNLRSALLWSHRWLGLTSSMLLVVAAVTGIMLVLPLPQPVINMTAHLHEELLAAEDGQWDLGRWIVVVMTVMTLLLQVSGTWLWWPTRSFRLRTDRGWWRFSYDLHNLTGVIGLPVMGLLTVTALGRVFFYRLIDVTPSLELVATIVARLHSGSGFPAIVQAVYALAGVGFVVQAVTGVLVWWRPTAKARAAALAD